MKDKNLPKLKKEIMKLFGSTLSINSNIPIGKNEIHAPEIEGSQPKEEVTPTFDKPENVNITIELPQESKQRDYSKKVKSFKNGKVYNIDIKKNETPLRYFLNNNEQSVDNTFELLKPVNFINYNLSNNRNVESTYPTIKQDYIIDKSKVQNIQNVKTEYLKEYVKILNNYRSSESKNDINIKSSDNIQNILYTKPYTFLTNSQEIVFDNKKSPDIHNNITNANSQENYSTIANNITNVNSPDIHNNITNVNPPDIHNNITNVNPPENYSTIANRVEFFEKPNYVSVKNVIENRIFSNVKKEYLPEIVPAFAEGGIVKKPTLSLIGEKEPEAIIPKSKLMELFNPMVDQNMAVEKQEYKKNIDSFIKTGDMTNLPVMEEIKNNENTRESLEQESIFMKMSDAPPKTNKTQIQTVIAEGMFDQTQQSIVRTTTTKGINQFFPDTYKLPNWRESTV
jgi:hypothetical protein